MEANKTLLQLAKDLRQQGCYLQAAKCLQAASDCTQALPTSRAVACMEYSTLLMDHFDNLDLAKQLLLRAERELRTARGHHGLKCEVYHHLIACHRQRADLTQALDACQTGLATSGKGPAPAKELARWRVYFIFRLAECRFERDGDPEAALAALEQANAAELTHAETALSALSRAVLNLRCRRTDVTDQLLADCAVALDGISEAESAEANALRAAYFLLYATTVLAVGRASQLQQGNEYPVFAQLQQALMECGGQAGPTEAWLPGPAAAALGHMLHAGVLRAAGKCSAAAVQLGLAEEVVEAALAQLQVKWGEGEAKMAAAAAATARIYVRLKAAVVEQRALAGLASTDLSSAARHAADLVAAVQRFPTALKSQAASACMLLGHYAHTVGKLDLAVRLFDAASTSPSMHMVKMASLAAALSELERSSGEEAQSRATAWLESQGLLADTSTTTLAGLPSHERAVAQLVNGIILRRSGDGTGARLLLTKALKQAHSLIGSTQLVGQVLNVLAPVQYERQDLAGAKQMFESAVTLLKSVGDLPSLVTSLNGLHALHLAQGDAGLADRSQQYLDRKAADLKARLTAVEESAEHARVLEAADWLCSFVSQATT